MLIRKQLARSSPKRVQKRLPRRAQRRVPSKAMPAPLTDLGAKAPIEPLPTHQLLPAKPLTLASIRPMNTRILKTLRIIRSIRNTKNIRTRQTTQKSTLRSIRGPTSGRRAQAPQLPLI